MAALTCDICGGKLMGKPGGIFECDSCGMEYSTEWARAKIQEIKGTVKVEGTVQVTGTVKLDGPVTVDTAQNVEKLLQFAKLESQYVAPSRIPRYRNRTVPEEWQRRKDSFYKVLDDILRASPQEYWVYLYRSLENWWRVDEYQTIASLDASLTRSLPGHPDWKLALSFAPAEEKEKLKAALEERKAYWREMDRRRREEEEARRAEEEARRAEIEARRREEEEARRFAAEEARRRAEAEVREAAERKAAARERKRTALLKEKAELSNEASQLKGFFSGKRRREIEARLAYIENELKGMS